MLSSRPLSADTEQVVRLIGATRLRRTSQASRQARKAVESWLGAEHALLFEVSQVVGELVNNAVIHSTPDPHDDWVSVSVSESSDLLRIYVTDPGGPTMPRVLKAQGSRESGRGMHIVHVLSHGRWTTHVTDTGHRVVQVDMSHPALPQDRA